MISPSEVVLTIGDAVLTATIITGSLSIVFAAIKTEKLEHFLFIEPTLQPLESIEEQLNQHIREKKTQDKECPNCTGNFVKPYLNVTMGRIQLFGNLGSILSAFIAQAVIFLFGGNLTAAIAYSVYAALPAILLGRYIIEFRDVFFYWERPWRYFFSTAVFAVGAVNWFDPFYTNFAEWVSDPLRVYFSVGDFRIFAGQILILCIIIFGAFLAIRVYLNLKIPSLRTRILRRLHSNPEGYTLDDWHRSLDPNEVLWSRDQVTRSIRELVYQGLMIIQIRTRTSEPIYKAPRH